MYRGLGIPCVVDSEVEGRVCASLFWDHVYRGEGHGVLRGTFVMSMLGGLHESRLVVGMFGMYCLV